MSKVLIAFFSRKGQNYVRGSIKNLPVGNTEVVAGMIQDTWNQCRFF
jgi:flavodoxin